MRKTGVLVVAMFLACPTFAANVSREQKRLETCGQVFKEIMDIPDGIPKDLLNKAECVIVIPSVLKFAIGIGGDFGRGVITCRTGQHFTGHWSAHALFALEGANIGLQLRRSGHGLRPSRDESQRRKLHLEQQSEAWRRPHSGGGYRHRDEGRGPRLFSFTRIVRRHLARGLDASV